MRAKLRKTSDPEIHNSKPTVNNSNIVDLANLKFTPQQNDPRILHCKDKKCPLHNKLSHSNQTKSKITNRTYLTHGTADCNTPFIVYLIQCGKCGKQYVGQTSQSLRNRFTKHFKAIQNPYQPGTLHEHFRTNKCNSIDNISITILHVITPTEHDTCKEIENQLKKFESLWMDRMKCEYPQGLNWAKHDPVKRYMHYKINTPTKTTNNKKINK